MKNCTNSSSSVDVKRSHIYHHHPSEPARDPPVAEPRFSEHPIHIKRCGGVFIAPKACFSVNGKEHNVQISVKGSEDGGVMRLDIDGERVFEVATRQKFQGNFEFYIDGMVVVFQWDLIQCPMRFLFRPKVGAGESGRNGDGGYSLLMYGMV